MLPSAASAVVAHRDDDTFDTGAQLALREEAMGMHASQTSPYEVMPPALRHEFLSVDRLQRLRPPWEGGRAEAEIFHSV